MAEEAWYANRMGAWVHRLTVIDVQAMTATCAECGLVEIVPQNGSYRCKTNRMKSGTRKFKMRDGTTFSLTLKAWNAIRASFPPSCAICGATDRRLDLDHCHISGKWRGLICQQCNVGLGMFGDDVARLTQAIRYLTETG